MKNNKILYLNLFLSLIIIARFIPYMNKWGGLEHDSGYIISVAKNLAFKGIYASNRSSGARPDVGVTKSIFNKPVLQDSEGNIHFDYSATVGPAYLLPASIIFKIFGDGIWIQRVIPLIFFFFLLLISFKFTYKLGGLYATFVFFAYLWAVPQFTLFFSYQHYAEHIGLLYLLMAYNLITKDNGKKHQFWCGIFLSLAVLTKTIYFLMIPAAAIPNFVSLLESKKLKDTLNKFFHMFIGFLAPILLFEITRFIVVSSQFGLEGYFANNQHMLNIILDHGSGLRRDNMNEFFILLKWFIWKDMSIRMPMFFWIIISIGFLGLFIRHNKNKLFLTLLFAFLLHMTWFLALGQAGWGRHAWNGLYVGVILISFLLSEIKNFIVGKVKIKNDLIKKASVTLIVSLSALFLLDFSGSKFKLDLSTEHDFFIKRSHQRQNIIGFPPTLLQRLDYQLELVSFIKNRLSPKDKIYYLGGFCCADIASMTFKIIHSATKINTNLFHKLDKKTLILFCNFQMPDYPFQMVPGTYLQDNYRKVCKRTLFKNPYYLLCSVR